MNGYLPKARYIIFLLVALVLAGCRSHKSSASTPTLTEDPAPLAAAQVQAPTQTPVILGNGWYLYSDPDGEFTFSYPPTTTVSAGQNPVDNSKNINLQFKVPDKPYQGMSIRVEPNPKRLPGADIARQLYEASAQKAASAEFNSSLQQTLVGGISAVKASIPSTNTEVTVIVPYGDKVMFLAPVHDTFPNQVEKETLELFYQIVNTIKFGNTQ